MKRAWIGLGGNIGDVRSTMVSALIALGDIGISVRKVSPLYETPPWGPVAQGRFLNACVEVETSFAPAELLAELHGVERDLQRVRDVRWGPRTIDLDLLIYEGFVSDTPTLKVPHPRIPERSFVLVPLADIAPELRIDGRSIEGMAKNTERSEMVRVADDWFRPVSAS